MKVGLISTTINIPKVLKLYRNIGPDVSFYIAADEKTPLEAYEFCAGIPNCELYSPDRQRDLGYACSELLSWSNDSRRDIALLEAVKDGAEIIVSIDDDMIPLGLDFFERFDIMLSEPYSGLQYGAPMTWCDVGMLTIPEAAQRGLPPESVPASQFSFVNDVQIGAMQGIILGIPDTDARTMVSRRPFVHSASDILHNGFVINQQTRAVFNSQLTAFRRELAPCFAQFYKWQSRNTDIFASLIMRRVMRERGLHTYFGPPFGFHNRNPQVRASDYPAEQWGRENIVIFQDCLDAILLPDGTAAQQTRHLYEALAAAGHVPPKMLEAAIAFLDDIEPLL